MGWALESHIDNTTNLVKFDHAKLKPTGSASGARQGFAWLTRSKPLKENELRAG